MSFFYNGPSIKELHSEYAKKGRLDPDGQLQAMAELTVEAPASVLREVLRSPEEWPKFILAVRSASTPGGVAVDAPFRWNNGGTALKSTFAVVTDDELSWTGTAMWIKAVRRTTVADAGTRSVLRTEESMSGVALPMIYPQRKLTAGLEGFVNAVAAEAERRHRTAQAEPGHNTAG